MIIVNTNLGSLLLRRFAVHCMCTECNAVTIQFYCPCGEIRLAANKNITNIKTSQHCILYIVQIMGTESVTPKSNINICTNHLKCH